jgi:double-stranded uracil-DNA glycosylase
MTRPPRPGIPPASAGLAPVVGRDPRILILGSFPSQKSLLHNEYYGNPKIQFWKIMEALYPIDITLPYAKRIGQIKGTRIALWDVVRSCSRSGSADARITNPVFNDIKGFTAAYPSLRLVALNGYMAARFYHRLAEVPELPIMMLPSTSPANARMTIREKIQLWELLIE